MVDYTKLKRGDVLAIKNYNNRLVIVDEIKCDKTHSSPQIYIYAELDSGLYIRFKKYDMCDFYFFEDIICRYATEDEKNKMYNAIGKHFTEECDKDWYNHFTDSSYFDIQDYLLDVFCINVSEYDDDLIYPDFINEIHTYIWDKLCKAHSEAMGVPNTVEDKPEMVNKQEFIEKAIKWLEKYASDYAISTTGDDDDCIVSIDIVEDFRKAMEE
jgi:hypothetical protein